MLVGLGVAMAIAAAAGGVAGLMVLAGALVAAAVLGRLVLRRLPGLTGDVHGAICEVTQLGALLVAPALLLR
jgi:cobalamin synthase